MSDDLPNKSEFSNWYNEILRMAKIIDVRYPVKGLYVWFPFGQKIKKNVYSKLKDLHTKKSHHEVQFPLLIPKTELMKEAEHVASFEDEVFWVNNAGKKELDEPLALRPTSETSIYPIVKEWIRSHTDLPLKLFQVVNTFRYETKHTRPLIREREISNFKEAHTFHESKESAENQIKEAMNIYNEFFDDLGVPYIVTKRPEWDKFPGAEYTIAYDTLMPDGKTLQIGTIHYLGTNFSKTFDVDFEGASGESKLVHQTSYGISGRCIASLISVHGDDNGLVIPPKYSPIQVVIVPILFSDSEKEEILTKCNEIKNKLIKEGFDVELDNSNKRPGEKFNKWELKGVPLRVEIGPRDIEEQKCVLVRRDNGEKTETGYDEVVNKIKGLFEDIDSGLRKRAEEEMNKKIFEIDSIEEGIQKMKKEGGLLEFDYCNTKNCGKEIEDSLNADLLGTKLNRDLDSSCINCGDKATKKAVVAKTY